MLQLAELLCKYGYVKRRESAGRKTGESGCVRGVLSASGQVFERASTFWYSKKIIHKRADGRGWRGKAGSWQG